jgi:peptide/nickel transport system permease protein
MALSLREREFVNMARFSGAGTLDIIYREIFPYVYAYMVVHFINTILFAINTEAALAVIGLSKVQVPTLGSIIFWALNYNALMIGQTAWIIAPIAASVVLFLGLFLTSTGYNQLFAERRGVA